MTKTTDANDETKTDSKPESTFQLRSSVLTQVVRDRKTVKVLGDPENPITYPPEVRVISRTTILQAVADSGWAPFHYDRAVNGIAEPWRAHVLWHGRCRKMSKEFSQVFPDAKPSNKIPLMLAACGCVILVNWLPQFRGSNKSADDVPLLKQQQIDDEHLMATAAMIQNLLLLLTEAGLGTYWSSGGQLGSEKMFEKLGIDSGEQLAGAIFVEFPNGTGTVSERIAGKHRDNRTSPAEWVSCYDAD